MVACNERLFVLHGPSISCDRPVLDSPLYLSRIVLAFYEIVRYCSVP